MDVGGYYRGKKKKGGGFLTRAGGLEISEGPSQVFGRLNGPEREVGGGRLIRVVARAGRWGGGGGGSTREVEGGRLFSAIG